MKTSTLLLTLFLFISGAAFAQDGTPEQKAKALTERMKTQLTLNDDQFGQVYNINLDFVTKMGSVKEDTGGKMAKFKKLKSLDKDRDAALKSVLTEQQFKDFKIHKQETREEMKARYKEKKQ
ncbi:protein of unknown function [Chitinophaga sp. CF118]|uniref:DUF4890 domain-containing protein n=1 Tax=Chitinophaga sp. CF118 TaxID=1884367 RepID=UPI0008E90612|nr:DUF4890 domain-containing protein [Chitinophaga sp. CF118]SFD55353.1 protein of unknown function [Chitinophaga sp. CF118]